MQVVCLADLSFLDKHLLYNTEYYLPTMKLSTVLLVVTSVLTSATAETEPENGA